MKHRYRWLWLLGLLILTPVLARTYKFDRAGVQFWAPQAWDHEYDDDTDVLSIYSRHDGIELDVWETRIRHLDDEMDEVTEELDRWLRRIRTDGKVRERELNGLTESWLEGTGEERDGTEINWCLSLIEGADKPVIFLLYAERDAYEDAADTIEDIYDSIRPM